MYGRETIASLQDFLDLGIKRRTIHHWIADGQPWRVIDEQTVRMPSPRAQRLDR